MATVPATAARRAIPAVLWGRSDVVLAAVVALLLTVESLRWDGAHHVAGLAAAGLAGLGMSWRRNLPLQAALVSAAALAGIELSAPGLANESMGFLIVYVVGLYSLGRYVTGWRTWLGTACVVAAMVGFYVSDAMAQGAEIRIHPGSVAFTLLFVGGPWSAGLAMRLRREREQALRSQNEALVRDQAERAEQARLTVEAERARIARELHDVVSHAISVSLLQARGARKLLGVDAGEVGRALDAIEHTNAQALGDMRRLLSLLREADGPDDHSPQPSLARLDELVANVRSSGLPVTLSVTGAPGQAPPGVELSAYRIVQEALTNVLRHAGPGGRRASNWPSPPIISTWRSPTPGTALLRRREGRAGAPATA